MRIQTFLGKVSVEALSQMDEHINQWLRDNHVDPKFVHQMFGYEQYHEGNRVEPVVVTSVWF